MSFTVGRKPGLLKLDSGNRFRSLERQQWKQGPPQLFMPHPRYRPLLDPWVKDDMFKGRVRAREATEIYFRFTTLNSDAGY